MVTTLIPPPARVHRLAIPFPLLLLLLLLFIHHLHVIILGNWVHMGVPAGVVALVTLVKFLKSIFPHFDGENLKLWLKNCEDYFDLYNVESPI